MIFNRLILEPTRTLIISNVYQYYKFPRNINQFLLPNAFLLIVFNRVLVIYDFKSIRSELNDIKYLVIIGFIQFYFAPNVYVMKLI